jgi:hypothetical protein
MFALAGIAAATVVSFHPREARTFRLDPLNPSRAVMIGLLLVLFCAG